MRHIIRFAALLIFLSPVFVAAQQKTSAKIPRVLILLDGSSSMSEDWGMGRTRFQQAGKFILSLIDSLGQANEDVEFGLRVFGHQYPAQQKNCYDTKLEIKFSRYNTVQMEARLEALHGYGVSPIAYSLQEAAQEDFENENKYAYSIILVTDGGESCDGDICKVVNDLLQRKIFFRPYIVSLVDYAPLKDLYACLGTFLTVSNEPQAPIAITKIVDAHREGFVRAKTGSVISVMPEKKKVDSVLPPKIEKVEVPKIEKPRIEVPKVETPKVVLPKRDSIPAKIVKPGDTLLIPFERRETIPPPKLQQRDKRVFKSIKIKSGLKTYKTIEIERPAPEPVFVPPFILSSVGNAPPERTKEMVFKSIRSAKVKFPRNSLRVLPNAATVSVPAFAIAKLPGLVAEVVTPPIIKDEPKRVTKPVVAKASENSFNVENTPAAETSVEVYFTEGNGKFYSTTPQILLSDPASSKAMFKFYRTVDADGTPDPIKSAPTGNFNLSVVGSDRTFLKNVVITPNMKNKIVITVSNGTLQFSWKDGDKRPVDKYYAVVKRNFVPQPMVKQQCDTILTYPPGNYHIEINTLPVSVRSTDLTFGATTSIQIDKPGKVQVTNTNNLGKVTFYYSLGDKFVRFYDMNIGGNPGNQSVELLPGVYEVHYFLVPGLPEKVHPFHIKSDQTTHLELL